MNIKLSGVKNIRDFSEYGIEGYIRSAHLNKLNKHDADILRSRYDLKTVIDLRTSQEVKERPDVVIPGVKYLHIPIFDGAIPGISHETSADKLSGMIPDMKDLYRLLLTDEKHLEQIKKVMSVICNSTEKGGILWHCTEGKDRCGIISALFLLSRGIAPQDVIDDYMKTNQVDSAKSKKIYYLLLLLKRDAEFAARVRDCFLAKREYIEPVMDILTQIAKEF